MSPRPSPRLLLRFADEAFRQATAIAVGTPLLYGADCKIDVLVLAYFHRQRRKRNLSAAKMRKEAYVLREWLELCAAKGRDRDRPEDAWLAEWREAMEAREDNDGPGPARVA